VDLEQQAKERLTGGVILVVLLVLLVPELLTGPRPAPPASPVRPDQAPKRSSTMELGESAPAREPVAASTAVPPAREAPAPASSAPVAMSAPGPALAAPPPTAAATATPPAPGSARSPAWTVQVATFSNRDNAARLSASLKSHGFSATVAEATKDGHKLFRVRVGSERDRAGAQKLLARLKAAGQKGGEIEQTSSTIPGAVSAARRP
jgi:cell division septation protein DedD